MTTLTHFVQRPWMRSLRTSAAVVTAGVLTGTVVFSLSTMVGNWS